MEFGNLVENVNLSFKIDYREMRKLSPDQFTAVLREYDKYSEIPFATWNDLKEIANSSIDSGMDRMFNDPLLASDRSGLYTKREDFEEAISKKYGSVETYDYLDGIRYKHPGVHNLVSVISKAIIGFEKGKFTKTDEAHKHIENLSRFLDAYSDIAELMIGLKTKAVKGKRTTEPKIDPKQEMNQALFMEYMRSLKSTDNRIVDIDVKKKKATIIINNEKRIVKIKTGNTFRSRERKIDIPYYEIDEFVAVRIGNGIRIHAMRVSIVDDPEQPLYFSAYNYTQWRFSNIQVFDWWENVPSKYRAFVKVEK